MPEWSRPPVPASGHDFESRVASGRSASLEAGGREKARGGQPSPSHSDALCSARTSRECLAFGNVVPVAKGSIVLPDAVRGATRPAGPSAPRVVLIGGSPTRRSGSLQPAGADIRSDFEVEPQRRKGR